METKQVIVVRKDLKMRKGKIGSQCAHASMAVFFNRIENINSYPDGSRYEMIIDPITPEMNEWIKNSFTKAVLAVDSEEELVAIYQKAQSANLPCSLITDNGTTVFDGIPTKTCVAVGPATVEDIDKITGDLKLL